MMSCDISLMSRDMLLMSCGEQYRDLLFLIAEVSGLLEKPRENALPT